jgi:hypothetical protein
LLSFSPPSGEKTKLSLAPEELRLDLIPALPIFTLHIGTVRPDKGPEDCHKTGGKGGKEHDQTAFRLALLIGGKAGIKDLNRRGILGLGSASHEI